MQWEMLGLLARSPDLMPHTFFSSLLTITESPQRLFIHVGRARGCGAAVYVAAQGILCEQNIMMACVNGTPF